MIGKGLVQKATSAKDKRRIDVTITSPGLSLLEQIEVAMERPDNLLRGLSSDECLQLNALLDKMKKIDNEYPNLAE